MIAEVYLDFQSPGPPFGSRSCRAQGHWRRNQTLLFDFHGNVGNLTALCSGSRNPGPGITAEPSSVRIARKNAKDKEFVPDKKLGIRGGDVPHSPVAYAYALVEMDKATLFTDVSKVTPDVEMHLENSSVTVKEYSVLLSTIQRLAESGSKLWLDPTKTNMAIVNAFSEGCTSFYAKADVDGKSGTSDGPAALHRPSPLSVPKAIKIAAEISGMKQEHLRWNNDITRTVHFGVPTAYRKECFTRVYRGTYRLIKQFSQRILLASYSTFWLVRPYGELDLTIVTELVMELALLSMSMKNLLHVCEVETPNCFGRVSYLGFECLSFVPIQTKLMALHLLSDEDISWVNKYHAAVWDKVSPLVNESAREWLKRNTLPIKRA
ncbi:hypothetical protein SELMODRAFT_403648 [Selaginella moellendorffii]|uniref:Peptidase M24 C-terminal domain-containing protein n=1 Tax=Selaginella moellendorffii TaxID=88036 RepID=D8QS35_SELML|nr:hypothetical protein SELMODRAFT_403648 [Selaginella moellendorffii]